MSRAPNIRGALWVIVMAWAGASGCTHNYYYGTPVPGCPPAGQAVTTQVGSVCDVPSGQVVVTGPSSPKTISSDVAAQPQGKGTSILSNPSRVVISEPAFGPPSIGQSNSRFKWKKPDPESLPIMKAEGALDDSTTRQ
jgi:hypothetical protein